MSSSDYSPTTDFIVWGIFALAFIVLPYMVGARDRILARICRCFGISIVQQNSHEVDSDGRPIYSETDRYYTNLGERTKDQVHDIRAREISKRLTAFSLILSAENMISNQHDKDGHDLQEECDTSKDCCCEKQKEGFALNDGIEASVESSTELSSNKEAKYTHICIPLPGYNKDGMRKPKKKPTANSGPKNKRVFGVALIRRERNDANKETKQSSNVEDGVRVAIEDDTQQKNDRREVPIFCAVCLGEYETTDRVCWSSNTACTHVFHHDCIFQWLKASGKRVCKEQRFSETPSVDQVLNFAMECPCCRQSFIDKSVDVCVDGDEENV
mmetsp:Transcript_11829/g.16977  ORF Transcript_11829/g.16977 Transcript_11829/m.16977 type:complete len:328 (-) Transcript_11829:131-1114(-)